MNARLASAIVLRSKRQRKTSPSRRILRRRQLLKNRHRKRYRMRRWGWPRRQIRKKPRRRAKRPVSRTSRRSRTKRPRPIWANRQKQTVYRPPISLPPPPASRRLLPPRRVQHLRPGSNLRRNERDLRCGSREVRKSASSLFLRRHLQAIAQPEGWGPVHGPDPG